MRKIIRFYPQLMDFINEADGGPMSKEQAEAVKIEDLDQVYGLDGKLIDMKELKFEMESAKTAIVSQSPLFAPYVHEFIPIYTWLVPTMGTDGVRLFVNPEFANNLTWIQKIFVIIHEIMHCVLLHQERGKNYDHEQFNIAGDYEINAIIVDTISHFTPATVQELQGLYDEKFLNMPVEQIYRDMQKNPPKQPKGGGAGQGQGQGKGQPGKGKGPGSQGEGGANDPSSQAIRNQNADPGKTGSVMSKEMGEKIAKASGYDPGEYGAGTNNDSTWENNGRKLLSDAEKGVGQGKGKGSALVKVLGRMYKSSVDWKKELKRYVADALAPEPEQRLGNKKYYTSAEFPLRYADKERYDAIDKIIIAVDVSGSMSDQTLQRITDEICGIVFAKKVNEIIVITFDDGIQNVQSIKPGAKSVNIKATKGGTSFQEPLDYVKEKYRDKVNLFIMMSDGGAGPPRRPRYSNKFIWIIYDDFNWKQPFGRLIKLSSNDV